LIDANSIPHFEYKLDNLGGRGWEQLRAKIPQFDSLPSIAIGVQLESELPEIRDISSLLVSISLILSYVKLDYRQFSTSVEIGFCRISIMTYIKDQLKSDFSFFFLRNYISIHCLLVFATYIS